MRTTPWVTLVVLLTIAACGSSSADTAERPRPTSPSAPVNAISSHAPGDPVWVTGRVATGLQPCGILAAAGQVWVSNLGEDDLVAVNPDTLRVGPSIKVGVKPCGLAYGAGSVWVEDYGS